MTEHRAARARGRIDLGFVRKPSARNGPTLRFLTCGSVDDGKSTLIGHLLYQQNLVFDDQLAALRTRYAQARHHGRGDRLRPARRWAGGRAAAGHHDRRGLPLLQDEDAAAFIVADTPGHEQYTRNMATGASRRGPGDPARRRAQGPAHADVSARHHRLAARHQAGGARRQQDRPRRLRPERCSTASSPTSGAFAEKLAFPR